ncbi:MULTISPECIES: response regulator [Mumia]|uniref:response regulator n=1 Tax=Mumia TaxID=1546255 RepID=UPI0014207F13|nr:MULTISPECIES: response regulator transcription factor [unclassified Mumia]QMW66394.1 response regulator transcription factor [Mumia sp. ZJ1417]
MIRVFVVDDHEIVRRGVTDLLETADDIRVVGEAVDVAQALARIPSVVPDVAVLDVRLPDGSGIDVCRELQVSYPGIRTLILTSYDDDEAVYAAILAGASGYLLKEVLGSRLIESVREVSAGRSLLDPHVVAQLMRRLRDRESSHGDPRLDALTEREREVLMLITEGLSNREIGERMFVAEKTVKNYVTNLLAKLGMQRRTQAAVFGAEVRRAEEDEQRHV